MERERIKKARGRPRSAEAHAAILDATMASIREKGVDALSIEGVAARAGVGKATIYRRWPTKELLAAEAVSRFVATLPIPDTGSLAGDVAALMSIDVRLYRDPDTRPLLTALVAAAARSEAIRSAVLGGFHGSRREAFRAVLARGVARGELPEVDLALAVDLLSAPLFFRAAWTGDPVDEAYARDVAAVVLRGLTARSP